MSDARVHPIEQLAIGEPQIEALTLQLHGRAVGGRIVRAADPDAPVIVLVHGMAGSSRMWVEAMGSLGRACTVVAPDLLGHGDSARFRGDYSLGNHASWLRDLLTLLDLGPATMVGQSLGGGVVMQLAYQYPELCERLVLVDAGGLGREVSPLLRLLALPGAGHVLGVATADPVRSVLRGVIDLAGRVGLHLGGEEEQIFAAYESLAEPKTRKAFLATLRSVVDHSGQRVDAHDRLYLARDLPTLVVWGGRDRIIPPSHAHAAAETLPHARVEIFEGAGHFPHQHDPARFARVLAEFVATTQPASLSAGVLAERLRATAG